MFTQLRVQRMRCQVAHVRRVPQNPLLHCAFSSESVQITEDAQVSSFDWWSALGMQLLTLFALVQQAPYALRRFRALMFALLDAWPALNNSEVAIVEDFCRLLVHGFDRPRVQSRVQNEPQFRGSLHVGN